MLYHISRPPVTLVSQDENKATIGIKILTQMQRIAKILLILVYYTSVFITRTQ